MSKYKSIGNYSSGWNTAPIRAPIMFYQSNPLQNQRAPPETVPSYGTVGYDEPVSSTYRGYYSVCSGYSDPQGVGCGISDPSDPCFESGQQNPSETCLDIAGMVIVSLNRYKIPQLLVVDNPADPETKITLRVLDNIINELNSLIYREQECVNALITGQAQLMVDNVLLRLVKLNRLVPHQYDDKFNPVVTRDEPLFSIQYRPDMLFMAVPLPVNPPPPVQIVAQMRAPQNKAQASKKKGGIFNLFRIK